MPQHPQPVPSPGLSPEPQPGLPLPCRHLSISVRQPAAAVYAFLAEPANWSKWASGLGTLRQLDDGRWVAQQADGVATIVFSPRNPFGICDHTVTTANGREVYVPLRVIENNGGAEVILTLYRLPGMDDATWERDAAWMRKDLERLNACCSLD